jgi:phosphopantothenoylcysteine decarboxylase/phosphopantothenate--cysteine ligase
MMVRVVRIHKQIILNIVGWVSLTLYVDPCKSQALAYTRDMFVSILKEKRILLGVTGSIACYKAIDLASKLTQAGALVDVIITESAQKFVSTLSFQSVTGRKAYSDMWDLEDHIQHVRLGESADLFVVAPATANTIAKLAHGLADNLLTVTALAARSPVLIAPAMDGAMFESVTNQANMNLLLERGVVFAGPVSGRMASGLVGKGRMVEPTELIGHIRIILGRGGSLKNKHVVVTAGPTQEPLDPVRFLTNRSSGKQGVALAQAALDMGAQVILITGPVQESIPIGTEHISIRTAEEMKDAVLNAVQDADILLMSAAVSDFRPLSASVQKIKKGNTNTLSVELVKNPDILEEVLKHKERTGRPAITLGFAAETENVLQAGLEKLKQKGLDFIAINDVTSEDAGFAVDTNRVLLVDAAGNSEEFPLLSKSEIAEYIVRAVANKLRGHNSGH